MNLHDWRCRIDEIDRKLVELLNERSRCALEIGKLKQAANLPLYQPEREKEVLENAEHSNPGPLTDGAIRRLRNGSQISLQFYWQLRSPGLPRWSPFSRWHG